MPLFHALSGAVLPASTPNLEESPAFQRSRPRLRNRIVVIGVGTTGRAAVEVMLAQGRRREDIVVVDADAAALASAACHGVITRHGSATDRHTLSQAGVQRAAAVIVAVGSDDTAVAAVRTLRDIAGNVKVFVAVHDREHAQLLRQFGSQTVVVCDETTDRLLGMSATAPEIVHLIEDLLTPESGYVIAERTIGPHEVGLAPQHLTDTVIGVVRNGRLSKPHMPAVRSLIAGDRVLVVRLRT
jgi:voltage-gated potassium channel